ncbi:MAG: SMC family ATPase, partial [Pyrinomonadaceae bacterium]
EVFRFLWQHLGLEPGTDLRSLFRQAIGVPQGTFTAIFLEGATERKIAFDRLLKVEEYRQAAEKLRETSRFLDQQVAGVREDIARAEGELARAHVVDDELATFAEQIISLTGQLDVSGNDLAEKQKLVDALDAEGEKIALLQTEFDRLTAARDRSELIGRQREDSLKSALNARSKIEEVRSSFELHTKVLGRLKELESERTERDRLRSEISKIEAATVHLKADQKRLTENLEAAHKAMREIEILKPKADQQETLEKDIARLRDRVASSRAALSQLNNVEEKLLRLREAYKANTNEVRKAEEKSAMAAELVALESRTGELMQSLATLQASLERDERFQSEIKNGLCPILSQKCLNLKEGETLEAFVSSQFVDLRSQITALETERATVSSKLTLAREAARAAAALDALRRREQELTAEGKSLNEEKSTLSALATGLPRVEGDLSSTEISLAALQDPRSRMQFLVVEAARESSYRQGLSEVEASLAGLDRESSSLIEKLEKYKALDDEWNKLVAEREATLDAYRTYLANEAEAKMADERRNQVDEAKVELAAIQKELSGSEEALRKASASYDRERHNAERSALLDAERRYAEMRATLDATKRRHDQLAAEAARFAEIRKSLQGEFKEKERLETVAETTAFIRDTLKEAAPRVARNYVYHVSLEANQMFREITGNAERTLKWTEDYSIVLEEDGYERPFASLSGGEQMSAALSVRLTLLTQLSDIRLAFFDEPTTNLDHERRENLAMQISRITHFDQLFVISHDDTFDNYVDHVIAVGN